MAVDATTPAYDAALSVWEKCRDASAGQESVHAKGVRYLPKLAEQTPAEYDAYRLRTLYYNATGRTVDGLSGLIFRRPPTVEMPAAVEFLQEDVDTSGTPLLAMCERAVEELLQAGRIGLLADFPPMEQARTLADERAAGARSYVKTYCAESIINWRMERIGNRNQYTLVVLRENKEVAVDDFETACIPRWRVLRLVDGQYQVEVWEKNSDTSASDKFVRVEEFTPLMSGAPMNFIPFLICGPMGVSEEVAKPPILDLVNVNLSHYRTTADYEHGLHFTGLPTPIVTGASFDPGDKFALGSTVVKGFSDPNTKAFFLEFQGQGLGTLSQRLKEKEEMMAALGARMIGAEKRAAEAAETAAIHRAGENSVLGSLANAASAAISKALTWAAQWMGVQEPVKVELNTDYLPAGMTAQELTALVGAWQAGAMSGPTLYDNLQRGEIARQGVDWDEEKAEIEAEGPKLGTMTDPAADPNGNGQRAAA